MSAVRRRGWTAAVLVARAEWRRRWRSHVFLAGVAAIAVTSVVATLSAATRSENAFSRLRVATHASDAVVDNDGDARAALGPIRDLPGVEGAAVDAELFVRPVGSTYFPDLDLYAWGPADARNADRLNGPVITRGRAVRPDRSDEVVLSEKLASKLGLNVGDHVTLESMTDKWIDVTFNGGDAGPADGPRIRVTVVGISRSPAEFGRWKGVIGLSPAFVARYGGQMRVYHHIEVRLTTSAVHSRVERALSAVLPDAQLGPSSFADNTATDDALNTTAIALRLCAATAALAGAVVLALGLARSARLALGDAPTLTAMGWTKRQFRGVALVMFAPSVAAGTLIGLAGGTALAPRTMLGLARSVDPTPAAINADALVIAIVAGATFALALPVLLFAAHRSTSVRRALARRPVRVGRPRRPLSIVLGVRNALGGDVDGGGRASRGALVVVTAGIVSIVAALTVSASISRLQTDPTLTGRTRSRVIDSGESVDVYDHALPILEQDRKVGLLVGMHVVFGLTSGRTREIPALAYDVRRGVPGISIVHGRLARESDEVALGPATLDDLHKGVGDVVELRGRRGAHRFRIVGSVLFPEGDFSHDAGVALTASAAGWIAGNVDDRGAIHQIAFDWVDGTDAHAADRRLAASGLRVLARDAPVPPSADNLGSVEALPRYLALLLLVMSLATLAHAMSTNVKRRAREFGTLQALGMSPRAVRGVVASQALTVVGIAVVVGVPIGIVVGTKVWAPIANGAHVVVLAVAPKSWIAAIIVTTIVMASVVAAVASWRAVRTSAVATLRYE